MYTLLEKGRTISADDIQGNFNHVGQGDLIPHGGNLLLPTTGVYDLGSDTYRFDQGYINTINLGSGTVNRCMNLIAEVTLTATASSIKFTGLNGEEDVIYEINAEIIGYTLGAGFLYFNGDSTTNNYGYQYLIGFASSYGAARVTSNSGIYVGYSILYTTTAIYSKSNLVIYANNNIKLILNKELRSAINTFVGDIVAWGNVWYNSATLTSIQFTGYFNPGTHIEIWAKR